MGLNLGNIPSKNIFLGGSQVKRICEGTDKIYQGFGPSSEQEFIQKEATGGPAQLLKVYGKSIVWRQLVKNGDFADTSGWFMNNSTLSAASGILHSVTSSSSVIGSTVLRRLDITYIVGHKYYFSVFVRRNIAGSIATYIGGVFTNHGSSFAADTWHHITGIKTAVNNTTYIYPYNNYSGTSAESFFKDFRIVDLTDYFGEGNEPTTAAEAEQLLGDFNPTYDPGSLQSNKTTEVRAYNGGTLRGSLALNLSTLTSGGVVVFPDGMCRVGDIRDEAEGSTAVRRLGMVDMGDLTWLQVGGGYLRADMPADYKTRDWQTVNYIEAFSVSHRYSASIENDLIINGAGQIMVGNPNNRSAADFTTEVTGQKLVYELATPTTYLLDTPLPTDLTCEQGDILKKVSGNNCPFVGEMRFGLN